MSSETSKVRFTRVIRGYMNPFFQQSWHLFAPDPLDDTRVSMNESAQR